MEDFESAPDEEPSDFGIKKIIDCKIGEDGQQLYKVKWQATWEPAESLVTCQHLIDEFWSYVNTVKSNEEAAQQHRKMMQLNTNNDINFERLSDDKKADIQRLIARANATSVGSLTSPSNMLTSQYRQQNNLMSTNQTPTHANKTNSRNSPHHMMPQQKNSADQISGQHSTQWQLNSEPPDKKRK